MFYWRQTHRRPRVSICHMQYTSARAESISYLQLEPGAAETAAPGLLPFFRSIPIVLFAAVQRRDGGHFFHIQFKTEQIQVLQDMLRIA